MMIDRHHLLAAALLAAANVTPAQTPEAAQSLERVTVTGGKATATRQDAALRDLPQSVSIVTGQTLSERGFDRIEDLGYATVNLQANAPYTGGVSLGFFSRGFNGSALLLDGYNAGAVSGSTSSIYELASLERVEVLRGPASVLYGQGNPGGVVNLQLKRPQATPGRELALQVDEHGERRLNLDVNQPLGTGLGLRVIGVLDDSKTFRDFGERGTRYIAPALRWEPVAGGRLDVLVSRGDYRFNTDRGYGANETLVRELPPERNLSEPWLRPSRYRVTSERVEYTQRLSTDWRMTGAWFRQRSRTLAAPEIGFGSIDDAGQLERYYIDYTDPERNRASDRTWSLRLQGSATDGFGLRHQLVLGAEKVDAFYLYEAFEGEVDPIDYRSPAYNSGPRVAATRFSYAGGGASGTRAFYVNDLISIGEHWKLQLGLRQDRLHTEGYTDAVFTVGDRQDERKTTPSAGIVWQPNDDTALYASATRSFLPQFGRNRLGEILQPETGKAFEIGWKQDLLQRRLALTLALFQIDKRNILQADPTDDCCTLNGGAARSRGLELELQGRPWAGADLQAGIGAANARWTESNTFRVGSRLTGASPVTGNFSLRQRLSGFGLQPGAWARVALAYGSAREWKPSGSAERLPAYTRLDLAAGLPLSERWALQVNLNNALDKRLTLPNGFGLVAPDAPRTWGLNLRWQDT